MVLDDDRPADHSGDHDRPETPGRDFQRTTEYNRATLSPTRPAGGSRPPTYKLYANAPVIALPPPETRAGTSLWAAASGRHSVRRYYEMPLTLAELSQLLWAGQGVRDIHAAHSTRVAPSAGALYPIEAYVAVRDVDDLTPGLYHYRVVGADPAGHALPAEGHALEQLTVTDLSGALAEACLQQRWMAQAAVVFVWTAVFARSEWKYGDRAFRYIYLDAGHVAAHVSLAAVALGLGSCQVGAFFDDEVNRLIGVDGTDESALYVATVGHPMESRRG
jgi:SagB-type dehydrogenase family enzyme